MRVGEGFNFWDRALREQDLFPSTVKPLPTLSFPGDVQFPFQMEQDVFHSDQHTVLLTALGDGPCVSIRRWRIIN